MITRDAHATLEDKFRDRDFTVDIAKGARFHATFCCRCARKRTFLPCVKGLVDILIREFPDNQQVEDSYCNKQPVEENGIPSLVYVLSATELH